MLKKLLSLMLLVLFAAPLALQGAEMQEKADEFLKSVPENMMYLITAMDVAEAMEMGKGNLVVLDIRPPQHYNNGHIKGSLHVPLTMLVDKVKELPTDKKIAVVCAMDTNSAFAVAVLRMHGFDAWIMEGGVPGWVKAGKALVK
jgi:rhodanese-related sulfurtransferase